MPEQLQQRDLPKGLLSSPSERAITLTAEVRKAIDPEQRTVEIAFASETPVARWYGNEILDVDAKSVRLDRIRSGGALLMDHNWTDQVGVVDSVRIGADKVARAVVRFGKSARASEILQDVVDGIRTNISFGYQVHAAQLDETKDGTDTYRITDWEPFELSFVSVPADISVGVGRTKPKKTKSPKNSQERTMPEQTKEPAVVAGANDEQLRTATQTGVDTERKRVADILKIASDFRQFKVDELAADACRTSMSVSDFQLKVLERAASAPKPTAKIGLTDNEIKRFSIARAINAMANPTVQSFRESAAFELECSDAAMKQFGERKGFSGFRVPFDVLCTGGSRSAARRDMTVGGSTTGGPLVATDLLGEDFISLLRNKMRIYDLGAITLAGLQGNIAIPKQTGAGTAYWVSEGSGPTESDQATVQVPMAPTTVAALTNISRRLILQSSIDVENMVQNDLATVVGLAIQAAAINGSGSSNQPTGILSTSGIGNVAGGTNGANPTWANIVQLETDVAAANADIGSLGYLANAVTRGYLKTAQKASGYPVYLWENGPQPLNGYNAAVTNAVPSNLTKGTAAGVCSALLFGNWSDLIIGLWGGLDIMVDPYSGSSTGTLKIVVMQDCQTAVRHPESFAAMKDALTS